MSHDDGTVNFTLNNAKLYDMNMNNKHEFSKIKIEDSNNFP